MIRPEEVDEILFRWISADAPRPIPWHLIWLALGGVTALTLMVLVVNFGLRRSVRNATAGLERQRRELEEAYLTASRDEQRLRSFANAFAGVMFLLDGEGRYHDVFGSEEQLLIAPRENLRDHTVTELLPAAEATLIMRAIHDALRVRQVQVIEYELEVPAGRRVFEGRVSPIHAQSGERALVVFLAIDITDRRHLYEQLRQAQKMEAVGRLAGGVAHDFNNILTAILGFCELGMDDAESAPAHAAILREIMQASQRAANLTRQLLALSRRQVFQPEMLDLNNVIASTEKLLGRLIGEHIHLATKFDPKLGLVRADPGQIEQVILNLVVNARDAMPQGGRLSIRTHGLDLTGQTIGPTANLRPGRYALIVVGDTGEGIDESILGRIFEPFFTTKGQNRGTGLGLSTVYGIVTQSGGDIVCQSAPGQGTVFQIYLPIVEGIAAERPAPAPAPLRAPADTVHLLLAEDDPIVRALIQKTLLRQGYRVREADCGAAAFAIASDPGVPIDLLLTDVIMPDFSGVELVRRLAPLRPGLKVLYISGYSDSEIEQLGIYQGTAAMLGKPFGSQDLVAKIEAVLASPGGIAPPAAANPPAG
jgi:PAS domain S-box-containing protein